MGAVLGLFVNQLCTYLRFVCKFRVDEPFVTKMVELDSKGRVTYKFRSAQPGGEIY